PSTQPPETEPRTVPSPSTSIEAPGSRGEDPSAPTTVARATGRAARSSPTACGNTSNTADHLQELLERGERVARHQLVNVREHRVHPRLHRGESGLAAVGVDPDDPVGDAVQRGGLLPQQRRITALPSVADHDDHGAPGHP